MRILRLIGFTLALASSIVPARSEADGPFGLTWGASAEELRAMGIQLKEDANKEFGMSYIATGLPKVLADQQLTHLSFGFSDKLWRVHAIGKDHDNEPEGFSVKDRYEELVSALSDKYGKAERSQKLGNFIYKDPQYFVSGIQGGQNKWFADFNKTNIFVQAGIIASGGNSRWRIIYENKTFRQRFEADRKGKERETL